MEKKDKRSFGLEFGEEQSESRQRREAGGEREGRVEREATGSFFKTHLPNPKPKTYFFCFVNMVKSVLKTKS